MVAKLAEAVPAFRGDRTRCRCFAHVINLVVKSVLHLFEREGSRKSGSGGGTGVDIDHSLENSGEESDDDEYGGGGGVDNLASWQDTREGMTNNEREELDANIQPLKSLLAKVRPNPMLG